MINQVDENKRIELRKFEAEYGHTIKLFDFKPGQLVQVRNTMIEKDLSRKLKARYLGPLVVIRRTRGGSYILAEMNGAVLKEKVAAFRVLPHHARYEPIELPENIHELIDLSPVQLDNMLDNEEIDNDLVFDNIPNLREPAYEDSTYDLDNGDQSEDSTERDSDDEGNECSHDLSRLTRAQAKVKVPSKNRT